MSGELLTVGQVSDKLQVHIMSVYRLIRSGRLKAMHVPGVGVRIEPKALEELLSQDVKGTTTTKPRRNRVKPRK